jgi:hypothetical protein
VHQRSEYQQVLLEGLEMQSFLNNDEWLDIHPGHQVDF